MDAMVGNRGNASDVIAGFRTRGLVELKRTGRQAGREWQREAGRTRQPLTPRLVARGRTARPPPAGTAGESLRRESGHGEHDAGEESILGNMRARVVQLCGCGCVCVCLWCVSVGSYLKLDTPLLLLLVDSLNHVSGDALGIQLEL